MSFPRYDEYKDSGVEWLGEVPSYWEVRRLKFVSEIQTGDKDTVDAEEDGEYPFFVRSQTVERISTQTFDCEAILTAGDGVGVGKVFHYHNGPFDFHQRVYMMNNFRDVEGRFLFHYLRSNFYKVALEGGAKSTVDSIRRPMLTDFPVSFPPDVDEQKAISSFLDVETSKIDGLVSEQRRLIELLKEKRQAVISHAVTKGLNPNAPMKPSGIQWLGDVPQHWEVGPLKRFWSVTDCKHVTAEFVDDGGIPLASIREVQSKWVELDEAKRTTQEFYDLLIDGGREPQVGDLIFSRNATVGEVAQVGEHTPQFAMGQDVCLLRRLHDDSSSDYWQHVIKSTEVVEQMSVLMVGATFKRINVDEIRNLSVVSPPLEEQTEIAEALDVKVERFDTLIAEAERAIELLQERRTALISAAVTGKIDVRQFADQETP